jgi:hypothetical protein
LKRSVQITLSGAFALAILSLFSTTPAHAISSEITLNSSNVQVVHNPNPSTDVLNMSLNVQSKGESGSCEGEADDLLETGVDIAVYGGSCIQYFFSCISIGCPNQPFDYDVTPYVEHEIGSASYGTYFAVNGLGSVSSKIVALATPPNTCGTWSINLQATGLDLSSITGPSMALYVGDFDGSGSFCFNVNVNVGTGIAKPHHGVHSVRHH